MKVIGSALSAKGHSLDLIDELAASLVHVTRDSVDTYLGKRRGLVEQATAAQEARTAVANRLADNEAALAANEGKVAAAEAAHKAAESSGNIWPIAAAVLGVVGFLLMVNGNGGAGMVGMLLAAALGYKAVKVRDEVRLALMGLNDAQQEGARLHTGVVDSQQKLAAAEAAEAAAAAALGELKPTKAVEAIGHVYYPLAIAQLGESTVVVDLGGATEATMISLPDSGDAQGAMAASGRIEAALSAASKVPVLLTANAAGDTDVDSLHGEEKSLRHAVEQFADLVQSTRIQSAHVPMLSRNEPLATLISQQYPLAKNEKALRGVAVPVAEEARGALEALSRVDELKRGVAKQGGDLVQYMMGTCEQMEKSLATYRTLRTESIDMLNESINDIVDRADLPHVHMFCPRCNQVPAWVFFKLGIDRGQAHEMSSTDLMDALQGDPEAAARLVSTEKQWPAELDGLIGNIGEMVAIIADLEAKRATLLGQVANARASAVLGVEAQLRAVRDQRTRMIHQLDRNLVFLATGQDTPRLTLSHQAVLKLSSHTSEWTCKVCSTSFSEFEARFGRMLRVKSDLLAPMWNTLWTEKADFRRSEKFRTDEELRQRLIDEQKDLLDPVNAYQADMRPVRENILRESAGADDARLKLESTVMALRSAGVLDDIGATKAMAGMGSTDGANVSVAHIKRAAEQRESLLMLEPAAQAARRPTAVDPIDVLFSPEALFESATPVHGRGGVSLMQKGG